MAAKTGPGGPVLARTTFRMTVSLIRHFLLHTYIHRLTNKSNTPFFNMLSSKRPMGN